MSLFKHFRKNKNKNKDKNSSESKKEETAAKVNEGIVSLNAHIARLEKAKAHTQKRIDTLTSEAQAALRKKDKKTAIYKIKLRKQLQNRVDRLDGQITNLELQALMMDDTLANANYLEAMSNANKVMKDLVTDEAIEKAEQVKEDLEEQFALNNDLNTILSEPLQYGDVIDDAELERDLAMLEQEDVINDPDSQYFLYQHAKNRINNKNKNKHQLISSTTDETDLSDNVDLNGNNNNNNNNDSNIGFSAEEEKELKELELQENVLLTREIRLSSSVDSGSTFNETETETESDSMSDSDMELVTDSEEYQQENKARMIQETSKRKMNAMLVTSGAAVSKRCFNSLHKSAMILCH